jgi:hypothetical protein
VSWESTMPAPTNPWPLTKAKIHVAQNNFTAVPRIAVPAGSDDAAVQIFLPPCGGVGCPNIEDVISRPCSLALTQEWL